MIGLVQLKAVHFNDSKNERGSHKDRHEKIGEGCIGADALKKVACHPTLQGLPFILETPNDDEGYIEEIRMIREWLEYDLSFNITVEMRKESNQRLVGGEGYTDFIVSSRMSSLILAQLAENPELIDVFWEILSNEGNEIYIKRAGNLNLVGKYKVRELRRILLNQGYILLGRMNDEAISQYNPSLREEILLTENDSLIVLGVV